MQPIFEGGALTGQLEYSKARYSELLDDYRKSIVSALGNVEDGLACRAADRAAACGTDGCGERSTARL